MFEFEITDREVFGDSPQYFEQYNRISSRGIVISNDKKIAMLRLTSNGCYVFPGGGIEHGEEAQEAFVREVKEETGLICIVLDGIGHTVEHKKQLSYCHKAIWFLAEVVSDTQELSLSDNEKKLGVKPVMIDSERVSELLDESLAKCDEYKRKFIQLRDKMVWEYVYKELKKQL